MNSYNFKNRWTFLMFFVFLFGFVMVGSLFGDRAFYQGFFFKFLSKITIRKNILKIPVTKSPRKIQKKNLHLSHKNNYHKPLPINTFIVRLSPSTS